MAPETQTFCRNLGWSVMNEYPSAVYRFKRGLLMSLTSHPWDGKLSKTEYFCTEDHFWIQKQSLPWGLSTFFFSLPRGIFCKASNGTTIAIKASLSYVRRKRNGTWNPGLWWYIFFMVIRYSLLLFVWSYWPRVIFVWTTTSLMPSMATLERTHTKGSTEVVVSQLLHFHGSEHKSLKKTIWQEWCE